MARLNKRGSLDDIAFIITGILSVAFLALIAGAVTINFSEGFAKVTSNTDAISEVEEIENTFGTSIDNGILFLIVGLGVAAIILAMMVVIHPVFFFFYFLLLMILVVVAGAASNMYQEAASNAALAEIASRLTLTSHVLNFLPIIVGVLGFLLAIVLYKTWRDA